LNSTSKVHGLRETKDLLTELFNAVLLGKARRARELAEQAVGQGVSPNAAMEQMRDAMRVVDEKYEKKEYFIVDVASAASAMREAFRILRPHLEVEPVNIGGKVVIGSLKGNIQGLGKDIVVATLSAAGFRVRDLGVDVPPERFVDVAVQEDAHIIAVSISVKETVPFLRDVVNHLQQRNLVGKVSTVRGGQAVSEQTCAEYGIDAYAKDAWDCVKKVKELLSRH
jgi:5-methyltetrahydrofolate--homocysteine methyltransferase